MKTSILKSMLSILSMVLLMVFTSSVSNVFGQKCPATVKGKGTARGCTDSTARVNLMSEISAKAALICPRRSCIPLTNNCYLNHIILIGDPDCKVVRDRTCPNNTAWECKQDFEADCLCRQGNSPSGKTDENTDVFVMEKPVSPGHLEIFPNPALSEINIKFNGYSGKVQLNVINILGQQVIRKSMELTGEYLDAVDISSLPNGIYKVVLSHGSETEIGTFNKE